MTQMTLRRQACCDLVESMLFAWGASRRALRMMWSSRIVVGLALGGFLGCAGPRPPLVVWGGATHEVAPVLGAGSSDSEGPVHVEEIGRTAAASLHLVTARRAEAPHRHMYHDLLVTVLRGSGTLHLAERTVRLAAGDVAFVPRGMGHWFEPDAQGPAVAAALFVPPFDGTDSEPVDSGR